MKIKSFISIVLVLTLCFTFMCGCSKKSADESSATGDEAKVTETTLNAESTPKEPFNILLIGVDDFIDYGSSDAILMLSIDDANRKLKITSFNRDTYAYIPGFSNENLNRAYVLGNAELLVKTIEENFGVNIDRYALANMYSFEDMLNAVGGVEMELTEDEVIYVNNMMKANGKTQQIEEISGVIKLSGEQALCFVRNRSEEDEFLRAERQREFIKALIDGFKKASVSQLTDFASEAIPMLNTDLTTEEKVSLVNKIMTYLGYTVEECSMPSEGTYEVVGGKSDPRIMVNDWNKTRADLKAFLYGE